MADPTSGHCSHLKFVQVSTPNSDGCEECLSVGDTWVHLRLCRTCGHVGLLRRLEEQARDQAFRFDAPSDHHLARAGRELELVLHRRARHGAWMTDKPVATSSSASRPLRHSLYRSVWIATIVSNIGTWIEDVGADWLMTLTSVIGCGVRI